MDRFDALGDNAARLAAIPSGVLDARPDQELQTLVDAAARVAGTPIAAVSLVLNRTQFFRVQVGMPPDLAAAQATDRCVSFCQVVVANRGALEVMDASGDSRVPQDLVKRYGIRAYYGIPLSLGEVVLGSLCVVDVAPRPFSAEQKRLLGELAGRTVTRLRELAARPSIVETDRVQEIQNLQTHGLATVRRELAAISGSLVAARIAAVEMASLMRALEHAARRVRDQSPGLAVLEDTDRASDDLERSLAQIERAARRGARAARALEAMGAAGGPLLIADAASLATSLTPPGPEPRWEVPPPLVAVERTAAVATIIAALHAVRERPELTDMGISLSARAAATAIELRVATGSAASADAVTLVLRATLGRDAVWSDGDGFVLALPAG